MGKPDKDAFEDAHFVEGEEEAKKVALEFMKKLLSSTEVESGFKVKLMMAGKGQESPVDSWSYDLSYEVKDFVEDVIDRAVQDVQNYRGAIKYAVRAFVGGRDRRVVFRLNVPRTETEEEDEFGEDDLEEAPTRRGIVHQAMRHNEVLMKEHRSGMVLVVTSLKEQLVMRDNRVRELEARLREYQDREEDVASLAWVRNLETKRIENEDSRRDKGMAFLQTAVPLLLGKVLDPNGQQNPMGAFGGLQGGLTGESQDGQAGGGHDGAPPHTPRGPSGPSGCHASLQNLHQRQDLHLDGVFEVVTMDHVRQMMSILPPTAMAHLAELHRCCEERRTQQTSQGGGQRTGYQHENRQQKST